MHDEPPAAAQRNEPKMPDMGRFPADGDRVSGMVTAAIAVSAPSKWADVGGSISFPRVLW
jgi:hypothetical protein